MVFVQEGSQRWPPVMLIDPARGSFQRQRCALAIRASEYIMTKLKGRNIGLGALFLSNHKGRIQKIGIVVLLLSKGTSVQACDRPEGG